MRAQWMKQNVQALCLRKTSSRRKIKLEKVLTKGGDCDRLCELPKAIKKKQSIHSHPWVNDSGQDYTTWCLIQGI